jgi:hypothetical protein
MVATLAVGFALFSSLCITLTLELVLFDFDAVSVHEKYLKIKHLLSPLSLPVFAVCLFFID